MLNCRKKVNFELSNDSKSSTVAGCKVSNDPAAFLRQIYSSILLAKLSNEVGQIFYLQSNSVLSTCHPA